MTSEDQLAQFRRAVELSKSENPVLELTRVNAGWMWTASRGVDLIGVGSYDKDLELEDVLLLSLGNILDRVGVCIIELGGSAFKGEARIEVTEDAMSSDDRPGTLADLIRQVCR